MAEITRHVYIVREPNFDSSRLNNTLCTNYISLLSIDSIFMTIYFHDMFLQNKKGKVLIFNVCRYIKKAPYFIKILKLKTKKNYLSSKLSSRRTFSVTQPLNNADIRIFN